MRIVRRVLPAVLAVAVVGGLAFMFVSSRPSPPKYKLVFDNAFGLTQGAEIRVAGAKVGKVAGLDVQRSTARAVVTAEVQKPEFGRLHADATCRVEPQSLIGEYFVNCEPGRSPRMLPNGGTLPVSHTSGTIPPDLVLDIMRLPQRQRLGIILNELGAGLAARGPALSATIRRAIPALQETDRVLHLLAGERRTLRGLTRDADTVLTRVASNSEGVARFVSTARDAAQASADRRRALAGTIQRLPGFLREARPVLSDLGTAARRQTPALRDLRASAPSLTLMLQRLGRFTGAAEPALDALGQAAVTGRSAVKAAQPTVGALRQVAGAIRQPATNLRIVGQHLDDRSFAVEPNKASPGGKGFTGLEALLQYPFLQSQAINVYDLRGYLLKLNVLANSCSRYTNAAGVKADPERAKRCSAALGKGAPAPEGGSLPTRARHHHRARARHHARPESGAAPSAPSAPSAPGAPSAPSVPAPPSLPPTPTVPSLPPLPKVPDVPAPKGGEQVQTVLDYLLGK